MLATCEAIKNCFNKSAHCLFNGTARQWVFTTCLTRFLLRYIALAWWNFIPSKINLCPEMIYWLSFSRCAENIFFFKVKIRHNPFNLQYCLFSLFHYLSPCNWKGYSFYFRLLREYGLHSRDNRWGGSAIFASRSQQSYTWLIVIKFVVRPE